MRVKILSAHSQGKAKLSLLSSLKNIVLCSWLPITYYGTKREFKVRFAVEGLCSGSTYVSTKATIFQATYSYAGSRAILRISFPNY